MRTHYGVALTDKEERIARKLRADGYTINAVVDMLETTYDRVVNATVPGRKSYLKGYAKCWYNMNKRAK